MYNEVVTLVAKKFSINEYGDTIEEKEKREVFARVKSIGMREKYEALQAGLDPEYTFILPDYFEYEGESEIVYDGEVFRVIRTYRNGKTLEITVTRDASEGSDGCPESDEI